MLEEQVDEFRFESCFSVSLTGTEKQMTDFLKSPSLSSTQWKQEHLLKEMLVDVIKDGK